VTVALGAAPRAHADDKVPVWLGIQYSQGGAMGLPVSHVYDGTAAAEAGLRVGDEIIEVGGVRTQPGTNIAPLISSLELGQHVKLKVLRGSKILALEAVMLPRADADMIAKRLVGKPAPDVAIERALDRSVVDLAALDHKVAVFAFFPGTCDGCASIVSALGPWAEQHARDPVVVLGAMPTQAIDGLRSYLARNPILVSVGGITPVDADHESPFFVDPTAPAVTFVVIDGEGIVQCATIVSSSTDPRGAVDDVEVAAERALKALKRR
jgi:hypothetical protein